MIQRFTATFGGFNRNLQTFFDVIFAGKIGEGFGAEASLQIRFFAICLFGRNNAFGHRESLNVFEGFGNDLRDRSVNAENFDRFFDRFLGSGVFDAESMQRQDRFALIRRK